MSNLAQIVHCPQCNEPNFRSNTQKDFCSNHCENIYLENLDESERNEARIVKLEKEVALLKIKLELCLNKLEIDDDDNYSNVTTNS
jgi:endogenous inhibitor of DNA gyrase (YacG/DUF329 family)